MEIVPTHDSEDSRHLRQIFPNKGWCMRCGMPWIRINSTYMVKPHVTRYRDGSTAAGCFPLCEACWQWLGHPEARIEYYRMMIDIWEETGHDCSSDKIAIGKAVANGG